VSNTPGPPPRHSTPSRSRVTPSRTGADLMFAMNGKSVRACLADSGTDASSGRIRCVAFVSRPRPSLILHRDVRRRRHAGVHTRGLTNTPPYT
jgi:hypothetical protein